VRFDLSASLSSVGCFYYLLEMAACSLVGAELRRSGFLLGFQQARNIKASSLLYGPCEMKLHGHF
jgi:hypothetical protein